MKESHYAVYLRARDYWNSRFNDIHVPIVYLHGRELLLANPAADADIVVPAILLHDVGWKSISEANQKRAYGPAPEDESLVRVHEREGVRIAGEILVGLNYEPRKSEAILRIIDGHDSRQQAISLEDALVKDADKVWRFTPVAVDYHHRLFDQQLAEYVRWLAGQFERWVFYTQRGKQMAREQLDVVQRAMAEVGHV